MPAPALIISLLLAVSFSLATYLQPRFQNRAGSRAGSDNLLAVLIGDSRRLFANHFFVKADIYFHSGYYPTIFDNKSAHATPHISADAGAAADHNADRKSVV